MKITFDPDLNVAYIRFIDSDSQVETVAVNAFLNVDLTPSGEVYGFELLAAEQQMRGDTLKSLLLENQRTGETVTMALPF